MTSRRSRRTALAAITVAAAVLLAGCADGAKARQLQQAPLPLDGTWRPGLLVDGYGPVGLGPTAAPGSAGADTSAATQQTLASLGLVTTDFAAGYSVALITDGASLSDPTLDFCGKTYDSEKDRTARRQVVLIDAGGTALGVLTESVLYRTPADATAALTELRTAMQTCSGTTPVTYAGAQVLVRQTPTTDLDLTGLVPEADRVVVATTVSSASTQQTTRSMALYQVRGRVMVGLYYHHGAGDVFTAKDLSNFHALASKIAVRLDQLDPTLTGTS